VARPDPLTGHGPLCRNVGQRVSCHAGWAIDAAARKRTPIELLVVGLLKHQDDAGAALRDRIVLVPLTTLQDALGLRKHLTRIRVKLQSGRERRHAASKCHSPVRSTNTRSPK